MAVKESTKPVFRKSELVASERYAKDRDILSALLDANKTYSLEDCDRIIEKFKKAKA